MYLPRNLISHLYLHLLKTHHALSPPVLLLVSLDPDALCACKILTALLKRDYIPHKIQPISGYSDLTRAGETLVRPMRTCDGGSGGVVVCLGVGGLVDLEALLGLEVDENGNGGLGDVEIWVIDARRPWNLSNVFGGHGISEADTSENVELARKRLGVDLGKVLNSYRPGRGGIIVFDDGDIEEELAAEREAYCAIESMPDVGDEDEIGVSDSDTDNENPLEGSPSRKRKSPSDSDDDDDSADERPRQKRRHDLLSSSPVSKEPSPRTLRRRLLRLRQKHERVLQAYYSLGTSYSEPVSSLMYSLVSELGREDNDLLWNAIVGVSSLELYGRTLTGVGLSSTSASGGSSGWNGDRGERVRAILRDEVRRLNPADLKELAQETRLGDSNGVILTHARSPTDMSIRLSPEPRFLLIRHWSLYDSMLHSPYLSARLHIWSDSGRRRLHKLLAKMGVSLTQCKQSYTHMDMDLKRGLRERLLKYAPVYGLDGLVPPASQGPGGKEGWGFVRCWGWKACLSALDVGVVLGAILEVGGSEGRFGLHESSNAENRTGAAPRPDQDVGVKQGQEASAKENQDLITSRFWTAYDALSSISLLTSHIPTAQYLHKAILRTGTSLIDKKQIRHLRAFRMAVVKEGPDVRLFTHPGALVKLALWIAEAVAEMEESKGKRRTGELVVAGLDEARGVYVVVGLGGGGAAGFAKAKEREQKREEKRKEKEKKQAARKERREKKRREKTERRAREAAKEDSQTEESEQSESDSSSDDEDDELTRRRGYGRNRFGNAFAEVVEETGARTQVDSFEHCVVEVKKEDLSSFLESLSMKTVVG